MSKFQVWSVPEAGFAFVFPAGVQVIRIPDMPRSGKIYATSTGEEFMARLRDCADQIEQLEWPDTERAKWRLAYRAERDQVGDSESVEMTRLAHEAAALLGEQPIGKWIMQRNAGRR